MSNEVNEDLVKERKNASFNITELTNLLDGSEEKTLRRRELEKEYYTDPDLKDDYPIDYQSHSEVYDSSLQKSLHFFHKAMEMADPQEMLTVADAFLHEASPAAVHFIMFIPALMGLATEEQQNKWLPEALEMKIIGSYAQTELGHGTFLRGLQTTATYDPKTQEFILNTPTLSSIKWWPGSLGKTANHAIVLAQLYIRGKCYGIHPFMVQIRSMEDHQPLPGITVGEIGPKMGMRASDNGFLKLDNVRIPYDNMFMKNAQVTKDGEYIKPKSDKLNYGTMVFVRVLITDMVGFNLARACTIATRYSAVRRQSEIIPGKGEVQILDYQAQQHKLLPLIALAHAIKATFLSLMQTYKEVSQNLERGDLGNLPELHAISSGLKALCSEKGSRGIEICRLACGGHGYLLISGLPRLYSLTVAACTYEGENTVLYLQTARFLLKCLKQNNLPADSNFKYLLKNGGGRVSLRSEMSFSDLLSLYEAVAYRAVHEASKRVDNLVKDGDLPEIAWNKSHVCLIPAAKAHIQYYINKKYVEWVEQDGISTNLRSVLRNLCHLYLIFNICEEPGKFFQVGLTSINLERLQNKMIELLAILRPDAVAIVDAFDLHDLVLNSALGRYDGQVYRTMFELAQKTPLNKTQVHESYYKYLHPLKSRL